MRWVRVARGLSWTACEKQDRVTYPCLLTSSDSVLSNTPSSSWHPLFFLHQSLFLLPFLQSQLCSSFIFFQCSLGLPLEPLLPLLASPSSFRCISLGTVQPSNRFYELNPFSHHVFTGLGAGIDLPLSVSSSLTDDSSHLFPLFNHSNSHFHY